MITLLATLKPETQKRILDAVLAARGDMPNVIKRMPRTGVPFNYKCFSLGTYGWYSDKDGGYRYTKTHPVTGEKWPAIPDVLLDLIERAKVAMVNLGEESAKNFTPDSALCNIYYPGDSLGVHIDRTERNRTAPILSFSIGLPATFVYGPTRSCAHNTTLKSGDVFVMAGEHRNWWHGIPNIQEEENPLGLDYRLNITVRQNI